jgi:DNA-binding NtrC family response regulator
MRESVVELLEFSDKYEIESAIHGENALHKLESKTYSTIISDVKMPVMDGLQLLEAVREKYPETPFVIMSAHGDIAMAMEAMEKGAFYFIEKGTDSFIDKVDAIIQRAVETGALMSANRELTSENSNLKKALKDKWDYIGAADSINEIRKVSESVAESKSTVLITGESGTGKELIAKSIHSMSNRSGGPFIKVNCAALPEGLIESELFGHEKGAFTGAQKTRKGKFELAHNGTLLLDEIGEMPLGVQAKLLRVLQEKEIDKVGGDAPVAVDVRIIATTNRDLYEESQEGNFREDLYYRLNVFHFTLPPLRERLTDIPALVDHFIEKYNDENGFSVEGLNNDALKQLQGYTWPGNIRELENTVERAVVLTRVGMVEPEKLLLRGENRKSGAGAGLEAGMTVAQAERDLIYKTLTFCENNKTKAADMLAISIRTLRNKLNEYEG